VSIQTFVAQRFPVKLTNGKCWPHFVTVARIYQTGGLIQEKLKVMVPAL